MGLTSDLKTILEAINAHPFLFVGSGFTHRYLGTEDWKGLISHFARQAKPETEFGFEWYRNDVKLTTHFRRAVRIYNWLKYDNKKTPEAPKGTEAE